MTAITAYLVSVVTINFAFSAAPHLALVWSAWAGLVFVLRDMVQVRYGHRTLAVMLAACGLSFVLADPFVAVASTAAFAVSELIDWAVFSATKRPLHDRLWLSSAVSVPVDTVLFLGLLDHMAPAVLVTALVSKMLGVSVVWCAMRARQVRA